MPPRKTQRKSTTNTASQVPRKRKRPVAQHDDQDAYRCAPEDKILQKECLSVRYTIAMWAAKCFDSSKERLKTDECFVREAMRGILQTAIEDAEKEHWKKSDEEVKDARRNNVERNDDGTSEKVDYRTLDSAFNAEIIERVLFWRWYFLQPAMYRQRCRQLEYNLATNGWYLLTRFSPLTICSFPTRKLAEGTALDEWRQENRNRVLRRLKPPTPVVREKSMFPCVKCKSNNTTYYPLQTRGADEPMTNFVTCHDCDTRFRRS